MRNRREMDEEEVLVYIFSVRLIRFCDFVGYKLKWIFVEVENEI
jgi:hypothetical protein